MIILPVPPSRPCIRMRARFDFTPGLVPSYFSIMALTAGVTDMLASPESVRAPPIAAAPARQMLDSTGPAQARNQLSRAAPKRAPARPRDRPIGSAHWV